MAYDPLRSNFSSYKGQMDDGKTVVQISVVKEYCISVSILDIFIN